MTKIHVLADESLGGINREYDEVDRKADVGDRVIGKFGHYHVVTNVLRNGEVCMDDAVGMYSENYYRTLEPTDFVHIDNKRYKLVDRKADVGERIIVTSKIGRASCRERW